MRKKVRIVINLFTAIMPFAAWLMMLGGSSGVLSSHGSGSLKYFTVLSNLFEGIASLIWLIETCLVQRQGKYGQTNQASSIAERGIHRRHRTEIIKFMAGMAVFLTFVTVMVFLGPLFGYGGMFRGANFWMHLIIPLAAIAELLFFVTESFSLKVCLFTIFPVLVYGGFYLGNILINGRQDENGWNDFYGFVTWGLPIGIAIFAGICIIVFLAAVLFRKEINRKM